LLNALRVTAFLLVSEKKAALIAVASYEFIVCASSFTSEEWFSFPDINGDLMNCIEEPRLSKKPSLARG